MIYWIFSVMVTAIDTWCMLYLMDTFLKRRKVEKLEKVRFVLYFVAVFSVAVLFHLLGIVMNWWKFVVIFMVLFALGFLYFKTTAKQMIFYLPLCYGMLVLVEFLILSIGGLFFDTIDLYTPVYNF